MVLEPGESRRLEPVRRFRRQEGRIFFRTWAAQDQGARKDQQDSIAASDPEYEPAQGILAVLSDGMGGLTAGKEVSQAVVDEMINCFFASSADQPMERILLQGLAAAQRRVLGMQQAPKDRGATLAAVMERQGRATFLSVGDSRILLCRGNGLIPLTRDHNRLRRIETQIGLGNLPPEARTDRTLRALNSFVGKDDLELVDRPSQSFPMIPGDRLLLMSDGVYEALTLREMTSLMFLPSDRIVRTMIEQVLAKGSPKQDNCTVLMLECLAGAYEGESA